MDGAYINQRRGCCMGHSVWTDESCDKRLGLDTFGT